MSRAGAAPAEPSDGLRRVAGAGQGGGAPSDARTVAEVGLAHAASHFFQLAMPPLFPALRDAFGLSWSQLGLLMTVFYAVSCVGQAASGFVVDSGGSRRVLAVAFALLAGGALLAAAAPTPSVLFIAAGLIALGNSAFHPADFATFNCHVSPARLGHAFALHAVAGNVGYALAPVVMTALATAFGWRAALVVAATGGVVIGAWLLRPAGVFGGGRTPRRAPGSTAAPVSAVTGGALAFMNPALVACMAFFVTINIAMIGLQSFGAALLQSAWGYSPASAAAWLTAFIVCAGGGMLAGGFVAAATRRHEWVAAAGTLVAAAVIALLAAHAVPAEAAGALACVAGFAIGTVTASRDMLVRASTPAGATGRAYGIVYAGVDVGAALGPAIIGAWLDRSLPEAAYASASVALLMTALLGFEIARRVRRLPVSATAREEPSR